MDGTTFYPATNDVVFKAVFGNDNKILMGFLNQVIGLEIASPDDIEVMNPEIPADYADWKQSRLDIRAKTKGEQVNIEMQVENMDCYAERTIIYQSKMIADDMKKGENYNDLKKTISINLLDYNMFDTSDFYSSFLPIEEKRHDVLSDKWQIVFFELNKISITEPTEQKQWLRLLKSGKEDVEMLRTNSNEYLSACAEKILSVNADEHLRIQAELREKARMDYNTSMTSAREKGKAEGIAIGEKKGRTEGIAIGEKKGRTEGRREMLEELVKKGLLTNEQAKEML